MEHHVNIPGFDAVRVVVMSDIIQDTVRTKLTQNLSKFEAITVRRPVTDKSSQYHGALV